MTAELAVIDNEAPEVVQLNKTQAKALDKKVRSTSDRVQRNLDKAQEEFDALIDLVAEAADGEIHKALGLKSWTVWVKDAVSIQVSDREERQHVVNLLSGRGLSTRAIGAMINVDQKTVSNDLRETADDATEEDSSVIGLDGKTRSRKRKSKDDEIIDAEVVEEPEETPTPAAAIVSQFKEEAAAAFQAIDELRLLVEEENWPKARKRAEAAEFDNLQAAGNSLYTVLEYLVEQ